MYHSFHFLRINKLSKLKNLLLALASIPLILADIAPFLQQGFSFDYNEPGQPVPVPITEQCETIHIHWQRNNATRSPRAETYYLQVYTSQFALPYVVEAGNESSFDWVVPFAPGTQYQICMFDGNGVAGGCQAIYTMIANTTTSHPKCRNATTTQTLSVMATSAHGALSQYDHIDQCTDLTITPKTGKPPYTLTVAPALHAPINITSNSMDPIVWTISLDEGFPFFLSLVSADGLVWAIGPMLARGFGLGSCVTSGTTSSDISHETIIGIGLGCLFSGWFMGLAIASVWFKRKERTRRRQSHVESPPVYPSRPYRHRPLPPLPSLQSLSTINFNYNDPRFTSPTVTRTRLQVHPVSSHPSPNSLYGQSVSPNSPLLPNFRAPISTSFLRLLGRRPENPIQPFTRYDNPRLAPEKKAIKKEASLLSPPPSVGSTQSTSEQTTAPDTPLIFRSFSDSPPDLPPESPLGSPPSYRYHL